MDFQDSKADANIATRKLKRFIFPERYFSDDIFGMNVMADDFDDEDGLFSAESAATNPTMNLEPP